MTNRISRGGERRAARARTTPPARYEPSLAKPNKYSPFYKAEQARKLDRRAYRKAMSQARTAAEGLRIYWSGLTQTVAA